MSSKILECPRCEHRFNCEEDKFSQETILCPGCHVESPSTDYSALILCSNCQSKLSIPLDIINDNDNVCPKCGNHLDPHTLSDDMESLTTFVGQSGISGNSYKRQLQDGEVFDKYRIVKLLGRGGMAEVYLAEHLILKTPFALKLMRSTLQSDDPVFIKRFLREAKLLNSISHPNIVQVFDVGSDAERGLLFIVMEYVEGQTLQYVLETHLFREDELLDIMESVAGALQALHQAQIVHRDIKPSNIMQTVDGTLKLMDLGIAKSFDNSDGEVTLTLEQATIGTPNYASPEQCRNAKNVDIRSDIYCLGTTLYHLASGVLPFNGDTPVATILNVMHNDLEPLEKYRPDLSDEFIALITAMMAKDPDQRPTDPEQLLKKIRDIKLARNNKYQKFFGIFRKFRKKKRDSRPQTDERQDDSKGKSEKNRVLKLFLRAAVIIVLLGLVIKFDDIYVMYHRLRGNEVEPPGLWLQLGRLFGTVKSVKSDKNDDKNGDKNETSALKFSLKPLPPHPLREIKNITADIRDGHLPEIKKILPQSTLAASYDFSRPLPLFSAFAPLVRDGVLNLDGSSMLDEEGRVKPEYTVYVPDSGNRIGTVSLDFMLTAEKDESILALHNSVTLINHDINCAYEIKTVSGKLEITVGSYTAATGIRLPRNKWINLTLSIDQQERLLTLWADNCLLGAYFLPTHPYSALIAFGRKNFFTGKIARLRVWAEKTDLGNTAAPVYRSFPVQSSRPQKINADNGFIINRLMSGYGVQSYWNHNYSNKPIMVIMVNLKDVLSWQLIKKWQEDKMCREYTREKFHVFYLPIADNMAKSNTTHYYSYTLKVLGSIPKHLHRTPQLAFFTSEKNLIFTKPYFGTESLIDMVSAAYDQIKKP